MLNMLLSALLFFSAAYAGGDEKKVVVKKVVIGDQSEDINIDVDAKVEDGVCTIIIERDGEISEFSFDIDDEDALAEIEKKIEGLGLDAHIKALTLGDESKFIIDAGSSDAAFLGVHLQELTDQLRTYFKIRDDSGVLVSEVVKDSPAEKGGIKAGDVIIKVDRKKVDGPKSLQKIIRGYDPEDKVKLTLMRNGRKKTVSAVLGEQESKFSWKHALPGDDHKMMFFDMDSDIHEMDDHIKKQVRIMKKQKGESVEFHEDLQSLREELEALKEEIEKLKNP